MFKLISWHVWPGVVIAVAAILTTIFDPSPLMLITIFFAWCVHIVKAGIRAWSSSRMSA
jgi:hypothetical protein